MQKKIKIAVLLSALTVSGATLADLNTGLVAYYCFDDASNLGQDCSKNGNNGIAEGTVTAAVGLVGGAASFGGYNNPADIHVTNSPSLQFTSDATISFAVNMTGLDGMDGWGNYANYGAHSPIAKSHDRSGFTIILGGNDKKELSSYVASYEWDTNSISATTKNYQAGQWRHFIYVFSNKTHTAKLYADGVLVKTLKTFNQSFDSANAEDLYLGKFSDVWFPLNGKLDEVRFYNRALSATEISDLYAFTKPVGGILQGFNSYSTTCANISTGKSVTVANTTNSAFDCEKAGLVVNPKNNVTITINGNTH